MMVFLFTLFAVLPLAFAGITDPFKRLQEYQTKLASGEVTQPAPSVGEVKASSDGSDFVVMSYFADDACADGSVVDTAYGFKNGQCYWQTSSTYTNYVCDGDNVIHNFYADSKCTSWKSSYVYHKNECFPYNSTSPTSYSFTCSSSYVPAGEYFAMVQYHDSKCQDYWTNSAHATHYCYQSSDYSYQYIPPYEYQYYGSKNCTGEAKKLDLTYDNSVCWPYGDMHGVIAFQNAFITNS